jgi:hypothetical protein
MEKTNMKTSTVLTEAKKLLWNGYGPLDGKPAHICLAIISVDNKSKALKEIQRRLGKSISLSVWLFDKGIEYKEMSRRKLQAHRLAWMNLLIDEYKSKGD